MFLQKCNNCKSIIKLSNVQKEVYELHNCLRGIFKTARDFNLNSSNELRAIKSNIERLVKLPRLQCSNWGCPYSNEYMNLYETYEGVITLMTALVYTLRHRSINTNKTAILNVVLPQLTGSFKSLGNYIRKVPINDLP